MEEAAAFDGREHRMNLQLLKAKSLQLQEFCTGARLAPVQQLSLPRANLVPQDDRGAP